MEVKYKLYTLEQIKIQYLYKYKGKKNFDVIYLLNERHYIGGIIQVYPSEILKEIVTINVN